MPDFFDNYLRSIKVSSLRVKVAESACGVPSKVAERENGAAIPSHDYQKVPHRAIQFTTRSDEFLFHIDL
jgi:hypothetical protein